MGHPRYQQQQYPQYPQAGKCLLLVLLLVAEDCFLDGILAADTQKPGVQSSAHPLLKLSISSMFCSSARSTNSYSTWQFPMPMVKNVVNTQAAHMPCYVLPPETRLTWP